MRGTAFARCALIIALTLPAAAWADASHPKAANNPHAGAKETMSDADIEVLGHVHDVDLAEIEMGQLALGRSKTRAVKAYAKMIVDDHAAGDKAVRALARARGAVLPTTPSSPDAIAAQQKRMETMDTLRGLSGADFDARFLAAMAEGHTGELARTTADLKDVSDAKLRTLLQNLIPVLEKHAQQAEKLALSAPAHSAPAMP